MNKKAWLHALSALVIALIGWFLIPVFLVSNTSASALYILAGIQEIMVFGIPALLLYRGFFSKQKLREDIVRPFNPYYTGMTMLNAVAFSMTGALITYLSYTFFETIGMPQTIPDILAPINLEELLFSLLSVALITPLCEELLYRGFLYSWLKKRISLPAAVWINSIVFALSHRNLVGFPLYLVLGLLLSLVRHRRGGILLPIFFHAFYNGSLILLVYFNADPGFGMIMMCAAVFALTIRPLLSKEPDEMLPSRE